VNQRPVRWRHSCHPAGKSRTTVAGVMVGNESVLANRCKSGRQLSNKPLQRMKAASSRSTFTEPGPSGSSNEAGPPRGPGSATIERPLRPSPLNGKAFDGQTAWKADGYRRVRTGHHPKSACDWASLVVPRVAAINACGGNRGRSANLGAGRSREDVGSRRFTRTRVRRRTSRCSGRSRRSEIGVTSTNRSCGAAERQGVRRTRNLFGDADGKDPAAMAVLPRGSYRGIWGGLHSLRYRDLSPDPARPSLRAWQHDASVRDCTESDLARQRRSRSSDR